MFAMIPYLALTVLSAQAAPSATGKVAFVAETNVKMFRFAGKSSAVQSKIEREGSQLKSVEIRIPVSELSTGMDIRDKHMRERIFVVEDGSAPDVVFAASSSACEPASGEEQTCTVPGKLSFHGKTNDFSLKLTLKGGKKVTGTAVIDVLEYGVKKEALAWTSVKVNPKTNVEFELDLP